jgi:hypothetical protein
VLSILLESYCNQVQGEHQKEPCKTFNSLRVLLQQAGFSLLPLHKPLRTLQLIRLSTKGTLKNYHKPQIKELSKNPQPKTLLKHITFQHDQKCSQDPQAPQKL